MKPVNTTLHLETVRQLPLSTYKLSYERSGIERVRIGVVGPDIANIIPDAVEIVPKRILPPLEKGARPVALTNFPVVNEQTLFMYGLGATKELSRLVDDLKKDLKEHVDQSIELHGEISRMEHILAESSDGGAEVKMRSSAARAKLAKANLELEMQRTKDEEEYSNALKEFEIKQMQRSEDLTMKRLDREDYAARVRAETSMMNKLQASQQLERARSASAEMLSLVEHERGIELQKVTEKVKAETEKVCSKMLWNKLKTINSCF